MKIMISITRLFRLGIRLTAWATPRVKEWHRERQLNFTEGHRNLETRNWTEAEKHLALAFAERRSRSGKQRVELLLGLAKAQRHQHKLVEAEHTAHQAIDVAAKARDHSGRLLAMEALVDVQLEQIKYAEAERTIKEIQRLEESRPKPDHALLARCSRKLAGALLKSSRQAEAMEAFQRAADLSEQGFGPDHPETASTLAELGEMYRQQGNQVEAQRCIRRALQIHRATLGADSY
jgi:tetratricopeptide (TPR) repeat protein